MAVELEVAGAIAQLGAAGLIGLMWLSERRAASERERQLTEQHERLKRDRTELSVLVSVLESNTRALASLESGQGRLIAALEHRWSDMSPDSPVRGPRRGRQRASAQADAGRESDTEER
ncbi:MAG: hypothetical protein AAF937_12930 [Planctomycetota bacterium]